MNYSSYKSDIQTFQTSLTGYPLLLSFLEQYKDIEKEESKKYVYTTKYKKSTSHFYPPKNPTVKKKQAWVNSNPEDDIEKIRILIRTYFNKITDETYEKISEEFIQKIVVLHSPHLFNVLCDEIINKCLYDDKYRSLYIHLCSKIWKNAQLHIDAPLNFKLVFLNSIQKRFIEKDIASFKNLNDEEVFTKKNKLFILIEIIAILFVEKYIGFDIPLFIMIDLLHLNNNMTEIVDIEFEAIYKLLKFIQQHNKNPLHVYRDIFTYFRGILDKIRKNEVSSLSKRTVFILDDCIRFLDGMMGSVQKGMEKTQAQAQAQAHVQAPNPTQTAIKTQFLTQLKKEQYTDAKDIYSRLSPDESLFYEMVDIAINQRVLHPSFPPFIKSTQRSDLFYTTIEQMCSNIDDIHLDVPDASQKLITLIRECSYDEMHDHRLIMQLTEGVT